MPDPSAAEYVVEGRLRLSPAPTSELAAAALRAQEAAGLGEGCDFIIVAVPSGAAPDAVDAVVAAAKAAP